MGEFDYATIGTSTDRSQTASDHAVLRAIMDRSWQSIMDFCLLTPEAIHAWQLTRVKELVTHAFNTVPLYHDKYSAVGFQPGDLKSWEDFKQLPILMKDELIEGFPQRTVSSEHDLSFTTRSSGSSGRFVTLAVSPQAIFLDTVQGARQFYFQSGRKYGPKDLALFIYTCPWWVSSIDGDYRMEFLSTTVKPEVAIQAIGKLRPKVLSIYPTYLTSVSSHDADLKGAGIELIVMHSEQSTSQGRRDLSAHFGIPALDEFSSEELTRIALECPSRRYHLEEDACYAEFVDIETKKPVSPGERGLVVGTNLLNEATPIIRYSQGDLATLVGNVDCECGSNFRVMESPNGRFMDSIVTLKGDLIPASCFMDIAYNWYLQLGVPVHGLRYQIVQNPACDVDIFLVPGSYGISAEQEGMIRDSLYELIPRELAVSTHIVDHLPVSTGVKYRPVISQVPR